MEPRCHQDRPDESRGPGTVMLAVGRFHTLCMRGKLSATALAAVVGCKRRVRAHRTDHMGKATTPPVGGRSSCGDSEVHSKLTTPVTTPVTGSKPGNLLPGTRVVTTPGLPGPILFENWDVFF